MDAMTHLNEDIPPAQAAAAFRVLAVAAPLVVLNAALWGVLAAWQRFRAANIVNMPVSVFYYLGPVLALLAWDSLVGVMFSLVARACDVVAAGVLSELQAEPFPKKFRLAWRSTEASPRPRHTSNEGRPRR